MTLLEPMLEERVGADPIETRIRVVMAYADWRTATRLVLDAYGAELFGFAMSITANEIDAEDVFAHAAADVLRQLPSFRGDCSVRAWTYRLVRHAWLRQLREPVRRRALADAPELAERARTITQTFRQPEIKEALDAIRGDLGPEDQTLLILRVDRRLTWREIARVLSPPEVTNDEAITKRAVMLRKRFDKLKQELASRLLEVSEAS
jgi:RNA polymerase sigma-70 factor (ECF subfamily)